MTNLVCSQCGSKFDYEDAMHEAELAWHRGEEKGDYVCPECGADDSCIEEIL